MSSYTPHSLFTFGGVLNTGGTDPEIWQCGVRIAATGLGQPLADPDAFLTYAAEPMSGWWGGATSIAPSTCTLNWLKIGQIGADGTYSDPKAHIHDYASGGVAGASTPQSPDILAVAVSWETVMPVRKHSYASHGRIYLPLYSVSGSVPGGMRITAAVAGAIRDFGKALLTLINTAPQNAVPVVASNHAGEMHPITGVRVGNVMDVQRRRKSALKETYVDATFP